MNYRKKKEWIDEWNSFSFIQKTFLLFINFLDRLNFSLYVLNSERKSRKGSVKKIGSAGG